MYMKTRKNKKLYEREVSKLCDALTLRIKLVMIIYYDQLDDQINSIDDLLPISNNIHLSGLTKKIRRLFIKYIEVAIWDILNKEQFIQFKDRGGQEVPEISDIFPLPKTFFEDNLNHIDEDFLKKLIREYYPKIDGIIMINQFLIKNEMKI